MAMFDKANLQAVSLAFNILGWIFLMVAMGLAGWRVWYIESSPAPPWGLAYVGTWKVCTYQPNSLQSKPIACHRYKYSDTYLPLSVRIPQNLLLAASILAFLGKVLTIMGLRRMYVQQLEVDNCNLFFTSGALSLIAGVVTFIAMMWNYLSVMSEEGIRFPPSFQLPNRPTRQEVGSSVLLAVLATLLMVLSGLFTMSFQPPFQPSSRTRSLKSVRFLIA